MSIQEYTIGEGDVGLDMDYVLKDADGTAVDVTGATIVFSMYNRATGRPKVNNQSVTIRTAVSGQVRYTWQAGETDTPGVYVGKTVVTFGSGEKQTFPNADQHEHRIIVTRTK